MSDIKQKLLDLLAADEKSAADREAKMKILEDILYLEDPTHTRRVADAYANGYRDGFRDGFSAGFDDGYSSGLIIGNALANNPKPTRPGDGVQ
ncbi:MAG: hypothetical protein QW453_06325 [Thermoprotei archaeon]